MKKLYIILTCLLLTATVSAQQKVKGYIYDVTDKSIPLIGASVYYNDKTGTHGVISDINGYYELEVPDGGVILVCSYLGYETQNLSMVILRKRDITQNIYMKPAVNALDEVVVSVGRFEQKLSDITVSMNVLKAADIARQDPSDIRSTLATIPGVEINDKQPSIRGGSGWTYGVGSRALIMVDGMSVLTPGVGEINWNTIPMENIEQVEVIKGASSVLYGSSALNGIINVRTTRPGLEPTTRVNMYLGIYGNPAQASYKWWKPDFWDKGKFPVEPFLRRNILSGVRNPIYEGLDISHARRIGNFDVMGALDWFTDEGYREKDYNRRLRIGGNVTYHDPNVQGLNYGANVNFLSNKYGDFFLWRSPEEPYRPSPMSNMGREGNTFYIDPFLNYSNANNNTTHRIKGRFFHRGDKLVTKPFDMQLGDITSNMGMDITQLMSLSQADLVRMGTMLAQPLWKQDLSGFMNALGTIGKQYFPTATSADYMDLIAWAMARQPFPFADGTLDTQKLLEWIGSEPNNSNVQQKPDNTLEYYLDYQFSKKFDRGAQFTAGATYDHLYANSANMQMSHQSDNAALFFQYDDKFFDKLNLSLGVRFEYYRVDNHYREAETNIFGLELPVKPVFRGGLNYQLAEYSFLRASFGQGYRYPSLTEKYIRRDIGGIGGYPNTSLLPESGFNAEIGFKQGYKLGPFKGFIDVAGFYTQYKDMIEFNIGLFNNDTYAYVDNLFQVISMLMNGQTPGIGAQFSNVSDARIYGVDLSIMGMCEINPTTKLTYNLGYVYTEPEDMNYKKTNAIEDQYTDPLQFKSKSNNSKYLKYRQKHSVKGVFDLDWKRVSIGTNLVWRSKTLAVDYFMVDERPKAEPDVMDYVRNLLFGDLHDYWMNKNKGAFIMDLRAGVKVTDKFRFQFNINNLLNTEYSFRPMDVSAPRSFVMQVTANF